MKNYYNGMTADQILAKTIVYDNNGESFDRFTIFTPDGSVFGMSTNPTSPQGFNLYVGDDTEIEKGSHLGKRLKSIPEEIKSAILDRMIEDEEFGLGGSAGSSMAMAGASPQLAIANEVSNKLPATTSAIDRKIAERIAPSRSFWEDRGIDRTNPPQQPTYSRGGSVGSNVTFNHWDGTTKTGTIVEIFPDGSMDVSCGFGHCLVSPSDVVSGSEKMARGSKIDEFNDIMENNVITEKQMNLIKNRLNSGALKSDAEIVQYIWDNAPDLTPDQNRKGIDFLMNVWKSPTGKVRVNSPFGSREEEALENFDHFSLAGFHDASRYGQAPYYIPLYDVWMKDGEYGFQYYYDGQVNIVGGKGMKTATSGGEIKYGIVNDNTDRIYYRTTDKKIAELKLKEFQEIYPNEKIIIQEFSKGGSTGWHGRSGYKGKKYAGGGVVDQDAVRELQLYLENDGQLYSQSLQPIQKNLMTKIARGEYDHQKAQKMFMYLVERADKKYQKDFGSASGGYMLSIASRKELCRILEEEFYDSAKGGEYDYLIPKKYQGKEIKYKNGGGVRKAPFKVGDMVYSYQNPNHKMRISFVEDRGVQDGVDYGWGIKVALKTDADGNYDPKGTYSKSSMWMSQNSVSKTKKEKYGKGGSAGSDEKTFHVVDLKRELMGAERIVVASFSTREEARADAKERNKVYDPDTKMFAVKTSMQLKKGGFSVEKFGGGGSTGEKYPNDLPKAEAEKLFSLAHPKSKVGDRVWSNFKRTPLKLIYAQLDEKGIKYGRGGSAGNPSEPVAFKSSNLYYNGTGVDANGNKVVRVSFASGRAWSIQTNGNLPKTHNASKGIYDEAEINQYVKEYGSDNQKKRLKTK